MPVTAAPEFSHPLNLQHALSGRMLLAPRTRLLPALELLGARAVLMVEEKRTGRWRKRTGLRARQPAQRLAVPAAIQRGIEASTEYQQLLTRMLELSAQLQSTLSPEQRAIWLRLEDAFFEYAQLLVEFHYAAGRCSR